MGPAKVLHHMFIEEPVRHSDCADTICLVISVDIDSERMCLVEMVLLASVGFLSGLVIWTGTAGARLSSVMAARYARDVPPSTLPRLPRGVFLSLLFAAVPLIKGWCPLFLSHVFFVMMLSILWISAGAWLLVASGLHREADSQRKAHIEEFISSPPGVEPPPRPRFEEFPGWLRAWEGTNLAAYSFQMALILYRLVTLSNR